MRLIRKKLTIRDLVIAVAAFALSLKLGLAYNKSPRYWHEADFYAQAAYSARFLAGVLESADRPAGIPSPPIKSSTSTPTTRKSVNLVINNPQETERQHTAEQSRKFAEQMDRKSSLYRRAVFLPWLPNSPEPPGL